MAHTERTIPAPPERVFEVLRDGWTFSDWVVGTAHVRDVDEAWPAPGSRIHHKSGPWPVSLRDETRVIDCEPPSRLVLRPKLWPFGELTATITLTPADNGSTRVALDEQLSKGPMIGLRTKITDMLLHGRNRESLRRLSDIVQGKTSR